jgi:hypothetical protein
MAKVKVKVTTRFKDITNPARVFEVGAEVEFADEARVKNLVSRGLVEVVGKQEPKKPEVVTVFGIIDLSAKAVEIVKAIADETEVENLKSALEAESKKDKPFKTVVDALNARIDEVEAEAAEKAELVELADGKVIYIFKGIAYRNDDDGLKLPLEAGEYRSETYIYIVGDGGEVTVTKIPE